MALLELLSRFRRERDDVTVLVTTGAHSAQDQLAALLPDGVVHQYTPYDVPQAVDAFWDHWRPDLTLWADQDLHPVLLTTVAARDNGLLWVNAQMLDEESHRWRWRPGMARTLVRGFDQVLAADVNSARNIRRLGATSDQVEVVGPLQEGAAPLAYVESERDYLADILAARPVWLAVSVSDPEVGLVADTHRHASRRSHRLLLILVPESCDQGPDLARRLREDGWTVALRSADEEPGPEVQILVADQSGELGLWYRLAPVSLLGHTFHGTNPRDPLEPASLGSAILFGPRPGQFRSRFNRLAEAGAARRVRDAEKLGEELESLLSPDKAAAMATAAWEVSTAGAEVTDRLCDVIMGHLDQRGI